MGQDALDILNKHTPDIGHHRDRGWWELTCKGCHYQTTGTFFTDARKVFLEHVDKLIAELEKGEKQ